MYKRLIRFLSKIQNIDMFLLKSIYILTKTKFF